MMEQSSHRSISALQVVVVLAIIAISASAGYLYGGGAKLGVTVTSTNTQTVINTSYTGYALGTNGSAINATSIYRADIPSIVTVEGFQTTNVGGYVSVSEVLGTGFVMLYQSSVYVITNFHVVDSNTNLTVTFYNGNAYPATVVGTDAYSDLAVVSVSAPGNEFHPISVTSSSPLEVGILSLLSGIPSASRAR